MEIEYRNSIYDRLLEINFKLDIEVIPDPAELNKKIGECHGFISEIEHFSIKISKEISIVTQALNNASAGLEAEKDVLFATEEIKNLPSIRDREGAANMLLRKEQASVTAYENDVTDLNNLLKAISLKIKNLNRANNDIKMQLRVFEAQAKIGGVGPSTNYATKSLMEEFEKSTMGEDTFEDAEPEEKEEERKTEDPSATLDVDSLLEGKEEVKPSEEELAENLIEPVPELSPDIDGESPIVLEDNYVIDPATLEAVIEEPESAEINLNDVIENIDTNTVVEIIEKEKTQKGGTEEQTQTVELKVEVAENKNERHTVKTGMDIDDLLGSFQAQKTN